MKELWLKFIDERGDTKRVSVNDEIFTIGRHSDNDLCILDNRLSREHARIECFADTFYVSDSNSSNGTTLNGSPVGGSVIIKNDDRINLGGFEIKVEADSKENTYQSSANLTGDSAGFATNTSPIAETPIQNAPNLSSVSVSSDSSSIPTAFFWLAPVFGLIVLILVGGLFFAFSGKKEKDFSGGDDIPVYSTKNNSTKEDLPIDDTPTPRTTDSAKSSDNKTSATTNSIDLPSTPKTSSDSEKLEQNANSFLRRIAQNDPRAFLTGKQTEVVISKINQFKGSSALAENFKAVKKNAAQFESLAASKNLKAQFLAAAALVKIGNNRGDPVAVANTMLPILNDLKVTLDNKFADDNLLIIAAYERGVAKQPRSLQSTLEALSKQTQNVSPREIRTIWFLKDNGKITDAEYNFALQFIAIGAIMQNPKDFNVSADAVIFN